MRWPKATATFGFGCSLLATKERKLVTHASALPATPSSHRRPKCGAIGHGSARPQSRHSRRTLSGPRCAAQPLAEICRSRRTGCRAVDDAEQRADREFEADVQPGLQETQAHLSMPTSRWRPPLSTNGSTWKTVPGQRRAADRSVTATVKVTRKTYFAVKDVAGRGPLAPRRRSLATLGPSCIERLPDAAASPRPNARDALRPVGCSV